MEPRSQSLQATSADSSSRPSVGEDMPVPTSQSTGFHRVAFIEARPPSRALGLLWRSEGRRESIGNRRNRGDRFYRWANKTRVHGSAYCPTHGGQGDSLETGH